jgi:eukaryotic-like serine/threonine-protein kinase
MNLNPGTRIGPYEIKSPLGEGGMGIVYRALDTQLQREVALKLLPDNVAKDADRLARFEREAQVLASLNHPNIAQIYGLEGSGTSRCIVMELVEGETLQERLKHGPIVVDEALPIAKQIAEALEAAHEKGITHRDLKPGNIQLMPNGTVKVLDFGLAKAVNEDAGSPVSSHSPTLSMAATQAGVILGTAAYMSPEQARGKVVDRRTDIFSFGSVLYEMLTGRAVFEGEDAAEILSRVLQRAPDWTLLPANTPPRIRDLLRICLRKDVKKRRQTARDVHTDIEDALTEPVVSAVAPRPTRRESIGWISAGVFALAAVLATLVALRSASPPPEMRLEITAPPTQNPALAISPDGKKIVFTATGEGEARLWLRSLDAISTRSLAGTDGAVYPFWSPDSRSIGFFADGKLKRIDIDAGTTQILASVAVARGGTWGVDDTILFVPGGIGAIFRISATGGEPAAVTRLLVQQRQIGHRFPQYLPDGRHFLYYVTGTREVRGVYIGDVDGPETRRLLDADAAAVYASSGHLLFVRRGTLFAQAMDPVRLELSGNPSPVAEQVMVNGQSNLAAVSASAAGPIIYRSVGAGDLWQFVWFDRLGKETGRVGIPDSASPRSPSLAPDSRRVALDRLVDGNQDIWLLETGRDVLSRFTSDVAGDSMGIWSPSGDRVVFQSNRKGVYDLYQKSADTAASEELLLMTAQIKVPTDWSRDGRFLLYRSLDPQMGYDLWALPMNGEPKPFTVVQTAFDETDGQFAPDGKWIAYQSNESGRFEVYVQSFPGPGRRFQMSTTGGAQVRWRHDGKELFYIALDGRLMAVPIQFGPNEAIEIGPPVPLFATHVGGALQIPNTQQYMVSPDGQRFLMNTTSDEAAAPITVLLNWKPPAN